MSPLPVATALPARIDAKLATLSTGTARRLSRERPVYTLRKLPAHHGRMTEVLVRTRSPFSLLTVALDLVREKSGRKVLYGLQFGGHHAPEDAWMGWISWEDPSSPTVTGEGNMPAVANVQAEDDGPAVHSIMVTGGTPEAVTIDLLLRVDAL